MTRLAFAVLGFCVSALVQADDGDRLIFEGYDPLSGSKTSIVLRGGDYYMDDAYMDGAQMEELRHENMPQDGLSLAMVDRIGRPNMFYLVLPRKLDIFTNCEFGPCNYRRSVLGICCESP